MTAEDIQFSLDAFADSVLDSPVRQYLAGRVRAELDHSMAVRLHFAEAYPEQLYDATYHVRIIPKHVWAHLPRERWAAETSLTRLVGTGPYRLTAWKRGTFAALDAASTATPPPGIRRLVWRFTSDPEAATNLVLSGEADLLESVGGPAQTERFTERTGVRLHSYPAATYGFLAFRVADTTGRPHPILGNRALRRALATAVDRNRIAKALFGSEASAPPGPMSQLLWIRSDSIRVLPYNARAASRELTIAGWAPAKSGGVRRRNDRPLSFEILVPNTSATRRQAAVILQEAWRRVGAEVRVTTVDFPVFQERIRGGRFDAYIGAYLDEPSPRGLADQWTRRGWEALNFGRYANPVFDSLFTEAGRTYDLARARRLYREAMDTLNADVPALFLYAPENVAAIAERLEGVEIDPYSWLSRLPVWRVDHHDLVHAASAR